MSLECANDAGHVEGKGLPLTSVFVVKEPSRVSDRFGMERPPPSSFCSIAKSTSQRRSNAVVPSTVGCLFA